MLERPTVSASAFLLGEAAARDWRGRQCAFAAAVLNPDLPVPNGLVGPDGAPSRKRFDVYRNNVVAGLVEVLKAAFPAVQRIVGDEFFAAMARVYVAGQPPRSPIMLEYGEGFDAFISTFAPAAELPYLRDVAVLERACLEAYHEADVQPLEPALLLRAGPDRLSSAKLILHPSTRIVRSSFPVVTLWQMNVGGGVATPLDLVGNGEDALIVRPVDAVEVRRLPAGAATFIQALTGGMPLIDAATVALDESPDFELARTLEGLLASRIIVGCDAEIDTMPSSDCEHGCAS
jgi:hypothetical protein